MTAVAPAPVQPWSTAERLAWAPPERLSVSEWAERYRVIVSKDAAEPGRFRHARTPYLRELEDALGPDDPVEEVVWQKSARVGGSEATRNALGYWIDQDPGPVLIVYPTEAAATEQIRKEITPLLEGVPELARHITDAPRDLKVGELELRPCRVYIGWAGSAQSLASRTIRYAVLDEVDKFPAFSGKDADPISLARRRTTTFGHRKKIVILSTPTTETGAIARVYDSCQDRRRYHVPCPACGELQPLDWAGVSWPKKDGEAKRAAADRLEQEQSAWYECRGCKTRIEERDKPRILLLGRWISEGHGPDERPVTRRRGYQISALYSLLGITWSDIAAQFLRAMAAREEGDLGPLMEFVTQVLGEPFKDQVDKIGDAAFSAKAGRGHKPRVAPRWAGALILTVDTQRDGFFWLVRAWGRDERSRLIDRGRAGTPEDLDRILAAAYPVEGRPAGETMSPHRLYIDSGGGGEAGDASRTDDVYRYALSRPGRVVPLKGWGGDHKPPAPVSNRKVTYTPPGAGRSPYDVQLLMVDTQYFKDVLASLISTPVAEGALERWELCDDVDADYVRHMTSERKIGIRKAGGLVERWEKISGRENHFLDCETYQLAAARVERVSLLPDEFALERERMVSAHPRPPDSETQRRFAPPDGRPFLITNRR